MAQMVSPLAALTPAKVQAIRSAYNSGATQTSLAEKYHVSQVTISNIVTGKIYKNV